MARPAYIPGASQTTFGPAYPLASWPCYHGIVSPSSGQGSMPGGVPSHCLAPDVAGVGKTAGETQIEAAKYAYEHKLFEPQDIKPADDDSGRFYPLRQLDGCWTHVSRATIDKLNCRWYLAKAGFFYAIRMED